MLFGHKIEMKLITNKIVEQMYDVRGIRIIAVRTDENT